MLRRLTPAIIALGFSTAALAHPGHDHSHPLAPFVHLITAAAIVAVIAAGSYAVYKKTRASAAQRQQDKK